MADKTVAYYFAYNSPYAFLANTRVAKELAAVGGELRYRPVYSPRSGGGGPDLSSPKMRYLFEDVGRFADAYGLQMKPGPFADTRKACLGFFFAERAGKGPAYHDRVYAARWLEEKDIGKEDVLVGQDVELSHAVGGVLGGQGLGGVDPDLGGGGDELVLDQMVRGQDAELAQLAPE